jgi:hypothetical protein
LCPESNQHSKQCDQFLHRNPFPGVLYRKQPDSKEAGIFALGLFAFFFVAMMNDHSKLPWYINQVGLFLDDELKLQNLKGQQVAIRTHRSVNMQFMLTLDSFVSIRISHAW